MDEVEAGFRERSFDVRFGGKLSQRQYEHVRNTLSHNYEKDVGPYRPGDQPNR